MSRVLVFIAAGVVIVAFIFGAVYTFYRPDNKREVAKQNVELPDTELAAAVKAAEFWINFQHKFYPNFDVKNFVVKEKKALDLSKPLEPTNKNNFDLQIVYSPDKKKFADPNIYENVTKNNGQISSERDVDEALALTDLEKNKTYLLEFCGTPCSYDDVFWIDNDRFVLALKYEDFNKTPSSNYFFGLNVYDLKSNVVTYYAFKESLPLANNASSINYYNEKFKINNSNP